MNSVAVLLPKISFPPDAPFVNYMDQFDLSLSKTLSFSEAEFNRRTASENVFPSLRWNKYMNNGSFEFYGEYLMTYHVTVMNLAHPEFSGEFVMFVVHIDESRVPSSKELDTQVIHPTIFRDEKNVRNTYGTTPVRRVLFFTTMLTLTQPISSNSSWKKREVAQIEHVPSSLDLNPPDFFLFLRIKLVLKGKRFDDIPNIQQNVKRLLNLIPKEDFL
ncbi:hypothetical protein TNCV_289551 [Trichonephila clavipes]|nr:hypothetical protein TNCV_289551 [Trichonephila clavipes]